MGLSLLREPWEVPGALEFGSQPWAELGQEEKVKTKSGDSRAPPVQPSYTIKSSLAELLTDFCWFLRLCSMLSGWWSVAREMFTL